MEMPVNIGSCAGAKKVLSGIASAKIINVYNKAGLNLVDVQLINSPLSILYGVPFLEGQTRNCSSTVYTPKLQEEVLIEFIDGQIQRPVIIGYAPDSKKLPHLKVNVARNIASTKLASGCQINIDNTKGRESIRISTKSQDNIALDEVKREVSVMSKDKKTGFKINFQTGMISIVAQNKIEFKIGNDLISLQTGAGIKLQTGSQLKINGSMVNIMAKSQVQMKGNGSATVQGGGVLQLKGGLTKIG